MHHLASDCSTATYALIYIVSLYLIIAVLVYQKEKLDWSMEPCSRSKVLDNENIKIFCES